MRREIAPEKEDRTAAAAVDHHHAAAVHRSGGDRVWIEPVTSEAHADPRRILAVRTGQALEGSLLEADRRRRLVELGRSLGLGVFDANLIIALVQDRARRGLGLDVNDPLLNWIAPPAPPPRLPGRRALGWSAMILLVELLGAIWWWRR